MRERKGAGRERETKTELHSKQDKTRNDKIILLSGLRPITTPQANIRGFKYRLKLCFLMREEERERKRETDRQRHRQTDRPVSYTHLTLPTRSTV